MKDYDLDAMRDAKTSFNGCVEGIESNCNNLIKELDAAADENNVPGIKILTASFAESLKTFLTVPHQIQEQLQSVVAQTEAMHTSNGGA